MYLYKTSFRIFSINAHIILTQISISENTFYTLFNKELTKYFTSQSHDDLEK